MSPPAPASTSTDSTGITAATSPGTVPLLARRYTHARVGGAVVRLVPQSLTRAEDVVLGAVGLEATGSQTVGTTRPRAVGFPAWLIMHDPANAQHALNLAGDLRRAARTARSKPGATRDEISRLSDMLAASAPHFLPTFLEEVARIFLKAENPSWAGQYFSRAREAERAHSLPIDEDRHRAVLLEFALAGALPAKELSAEARSLVSRTDPQRALDLYLHLNLERVRGGLPPHATLAKDLRLVIKAAGADRDQVEEDLLASLLACPATARAAGGFWKPFKKALASLCSRDPRARAALAAIAPASIDCPEWFALIAGTGVLEGLRSGELDVPTWVRASLKAYEDRRCVLADRAYPRVLADVIRTLPGLEGVTIDSGVEEAEVWDALLAAGARLVTWSDGYPKHLTLKDWAKQPEVRPLDALAASEHADLAAEAVGDIVYRHLETVLAHDSTRALLHRWVSMRLAPDPALRQLEEEIETLHRVMNPEAASELGEELAALLGRLEGPELLAGALRDGLAAELAWPALETAAGRLRATHGAKATVTFHEAWPAVGVACQGEIIWVDGEAEVASAAFVPPGGTGADDWVCTLIGGVTGCLCERGDDDVLVWSDDPGTLHDGSQVRTWGWEASLSLPVPGGRLGGRGLVRVGEVPAGLGAVGRVWSDAGRYWILCSGAWRDSAERAVEVDPRTGRTGRASLPPRLAETIEPYLRKGYRLEARAVTWCEAAPTTTGSLLSTAEGEHHWIALNPPEHGDQQICLDADSQALVLRPSARVLGRLARPGGGHWLLADDGLCVQRGTEAVRLPSSRTADGPRHLVEDLPYAAHFHLRARDEAASARMRAATPQTVTALWEAARDAEGEGLSAELRETAAAFLGAQTGGGRGGSQDTALVDAVARLALRVRRLVRKGLKAKERLGTSVKDGSSAPPPAPAPSISAEPLAVRAGRLAAATGWPRAAAVYLLVGRPGWQNRWPQDFMGRALREEVGLSLSEATMARGFLKGLPSGHLEHALRAGGDEAADPGGPLDHVDVDAVGAYWGEHCPAQVRLDEELFMTAESEFMGHSGAGLLAHLVHQGLTQDDIHLAVWLAAALERSDPVRSWLADQLEAQAGDRFADLVADLRVSEPGWGQDPLVTAPDLVDEVAGALGVGQDSARYYLQVLALLDPTDTHIQTWNRWRPAARRAAAAPLIEAGLLIEGKRARARRSVFLPGRWFADSAPYLPVEEWKALQDTTSDDPQDAYPTFGAFFSAPPFGAGFTAAWERYRSGDVPALEEFTTTARSTR